MKVGEKVVCVKRGKWSGNYAGDEPVFGKVYLINATYRDPGGELALIIDGVDNGSVEAGFYGYNARRFRKLQPPKTKSLSLELAEKAVKHSEQIETEILIEQI